jgi:hypothetical protein
MEEFYDVKLKRTGSNAVGKGISKATTKYRIRNIRKTTRKTKRRQ